MDLIFCYFFAAKKIRNTIVAGASVSVFCLLSQNKNQIYNMFIKQIWPCSSVFSKPSPMKYHNTTVNGQDTNLLWLLSFWLESIKIICLVLLLNLSYFCIVVHCISISWIRLKMDILFYSILPSLLPCRIWHVCVQLNAVLPKNVKPGLLWERAVLFWER